jgi:transposase
VRKARQAAARRVAICESCSLTKRAGRINRPRPCSAPIGTRPEVAAQLIRQYIYLYGAVSPADGCCVYLIMPTSNTACFQAFLQMLARKFTRQDILLVLDGAPNHRCANLAVPDNSTLLYLPPYSPELNPKENIWDEIREKIFKNYAAPGYRMSDEIRMLVARSARVPQGSRFSSGDYRDVHAARLQPQDTCAHKLYDAVRLRIP